MLGLNTIQQLQQGNGEEQMEILVVYLSASSGCFMGGKDSGFIPEVDTKIY